MAVQTLQKDPKIKLAEFTFLQLEKVLSKRRLFSKKHQSYHNAGVELYEKFNNYIDNFKELSCVVGEYDFYIDKHSVYHNDDPFDSIAFKLYKDGIRKLTFREDLLKDEFIKFLDIIESNYDSMGFAEDSLQTELWKQDFKSIHYFAIEGLSDKEKASDESENELDAYFEEFTKYVNKDSIDQVQLTELKSFSVDREAFLPEGLLKETPMEIVDDAQLAKVSSLNEAEFTQIMTHVQQSDEQVVFNKFVLILLHLLEYHNIGVEKEIVIELFQKIIVYYIGRGDFDRIVDIIRSLRNAIVSNQNFNREDYKKSIDSIDFEDSMEAIKSNNTDYWAERCKTLYSFLSLFSHEKTNEIYENLFGIEQLHGCEVVFFKMMLERGKDSLPFLVSLLLGKNNKIAKHASAIIQEINSPEVVDMLMSSLENSDRAVHMTIFKLLDSMSCVDRVDVWERFLNDSNHRIRKLALNKIVNNFQKKAFPIILNHLKKDNAEFFFYEERKEIFRVTAKLFEQQFLPYVEQIMARMSFFISERKINEKLCAVEALSEMKSPQSQALLKKATRTWNRKVRKAARLVSKRLEE